MLIPTTFEDILDNQSLIITMLNNGCARLPQDQDKYETYKTSVPKETRIQYIRGEIDTLGHLLPNRFPYTSFLQFLPQVQHHLLWNEFKLTKSEIEKVLSDKFSTNRHFFFENPPSRKSVLEITHYHIFVEVI